MSSTINSLPNNSRFYILFFSFLLSLFLACSARLFFASDQLYYIRLEQLFGLASVIFLYIALIIGPVEKVVGKRQWISQVVFARRAIGVSAAYFALLHTVVALFGQIGGFGGLALLPQRFVWALLFGAISLLVLLLMAATSFNKVISFMTFRKWKWLHRMVYIGSILLLLHVWMIGTHLAYAWVQIAVFIPLSVLLGLESWCTTQKYRSHSWVRANAVTVAIAAWLLSSLLLFMVPSLVQNYHGDHSKQAAPTSLSGQGDHE